MTKHVKNSKVNILSLNDPKRCSSISNVHRPVTSLWINRDFVVVVVVVVVVLLCSQLWA